MNHTKLFATIDASKLPKKIKDAIKESILKQKINCDNADNLNSAFVWANTSDGDAVWRHLHDVIHYGTKLNVKKIPASWKKGKPTVKKDPLVFETIASCTGLPKSVRDAAIASLKKQKITISPVSKSVIAAFSWGSTLEGPHVWEHLDNVIDGARFRKSRVPAHWLVTPSAKKVAAAPKKLGFKDIKVCATIRACENIPGIVRQKLIAEVIDVANGAYKETHPMAEVQLGARSIDSAMTWSDMPSGHNLWSAVSDCSEESGKIWPW